MAACELEEWEADRVFLAPIFHANRLSDEERLDVDTLVAEVRANGVAAKTLTGIDEMEEEILATARRNDVIVTMSSGSFEGLPQRLLARLAERSA